MTKKITIEFDYSDYFQREISLPLTESELKDLIHDIVCEVTDEIEKNSTDYIANYYELTELTEEEETE